MKNIPVALKVLINIILFLIYSFIWIILWDFLYWLIQVIIKNPVAWSLDPIHEKVAIISILIILLVSWLFRKYFYFPIYIRQEVKQIEKKEIYTQKVKQEVKQEIEEEQIEEPKMKIYIDKEIK